MNILYFLCGVVIGALGYHFYHGKMQSSVPAPDQDSVIRLTALEEQVAYLASQLEELAENRARSQPKTARKASSVVSGRQERVLSLIADGLDLKTIARETGVPLGQVELIARLHGKE